MKLTISNYRCFSDSHPIRIDIEKGFTSFIGPNNSGKSAILKLIYEFRNILKNSIRHGSTQAFKQGAPLLTLPLGSVGLLNVQHFDEIFCNLNTSGLIVQIEIQPSRPDPALTSIKFEFSRGGGYDYSISYYWKPEIAGSPLEGYPLSFEHRELLQQKQGKRKIADCNDLFAAIEALTNSFYIGSSRNALNQGAGKHYDIALGTDFIKTWDNWKNGTNKSHNKKTLQVEEDIRRLMGFNFLEINPTDDNQTLQVIINKRHYLLREVGSGLEQLIVTLANVAIASPSYILIDEPELNLHPSLQRDFLLSLASYASEGVVFATHSIGLARSTAERIYSVRKLKDKHIVKPLEATSHYAEFIGEMSFSSYKEMGFDELLLVEGVTDVKTIQQFLRLVGIDQNIVIVPLGGDSLTRGGVEHELEELKRITSNISAIVDSEKSSKESQPAEKRRKFAEICKKIGINLHLTERRATENYFTERAIQEEHGPKYSALTEYEMLGSKQLSWGKPDNWRIARRMTLEELSSTDLGKFILELENKLLGKKTVSIVGRRDAGPGTKNI